MSQPDTSRGPRGRGRSIKVSQTARPRLAPLAKLGKERFRLVWLGEIHRPVGATSPTGHAIIARFVNESQQINVSLPLPTLPLLALGSVWKEGLFIGYWPSKTATVTVDMSALTDAQRVAYDPYEIVARSAYPLSMGRRSSCRLLPTVDGGEIIVPFSELLRTSYFFDARIIEPLLAGGFANSPLASSLRLPWLPEGTRRLSDDEVMLTHRQGVGEAVARRLSRLLFDNVAQQSIARLSVAYRQQSHHSAFLLPFVEPAFEARAQWHVRYVDIPSYGKHPARRLVLTILGQEQELPYKRLILFPDIDSRQGSNSDDPNLKPVAPRTSSVVIPDDGSLALYGGAAEPGLDSVPVAGLAFHDNVLEVPVVRPPKTWQAYRSEGGPRDPSVSVSGVGIDPTAQSTPGLAGQRDAEPEPGSIVGGPAPTPIALVDVRPVFDDLIKLLEPRLPGWRVEYFETPNAAPGVIRVQHFRSKVFRPFLILHIYHELRHVYVLKAGPLADHERYRLLICEQLSGAAMPRPALGQWLSRFPYHEGNQWIDSSSRHRLLLRHDALVHQRRESGKDPAAIHRAFVDRIAERVTGFVA